MGSYLRDVLVEVMPNAVGRWLGKTLPYAPDFVFLTHPRNLEDIYATFPFIRLLSRLFPKQTIEKILQWAPCYVVSHVRGPFGKKGYVMGVPVLPEKLFAQRKETERLIGRIMSFLNKMTDRKTYVGLAAWWPIVSNSGISFYEAGKKYDNLRVTNGHTATLLSLYLTTLKLAEDLNIPIRKLRLLIIGVGRVGGVLADLFASKVKQLGLLDKNPTRLETVRRGLKAVPLNNQCELISMSGDSQQEKLCEKLKHYDIALCTTSNMNLLVDDASSLEDCIIVDDSRPEAFPRVCSSEKKVLVLEGGLMHIPGVSLDSDFGFGTTNDIFGCLAEAIILSIDEEKTLRPNVGEIDYENFYKMKDFCSSVNIKAGQLKCGQKIVSDKEIELFVMEEKSR